MAVLWRSIALLFLTRFSAVTADVLSVLILSKTCDLVRNTSALIGQASQLQQHTFELDCVRTSLEFYQHKTQKNYSFFLGDILETACLDANQGVVPLASVISQGTQRQA